MLRTLLFLTAFCILASGNARAAVPIDEAGAENIRTIVQTLLDRQKAVRELSGGALETKGVLTVEMARTYYAITLPHITLVDPAGRRAEIGMIALNATPAGQEGKWRLSIALPTPMTWFDTEGNLSMRVHLGAQQLSGVWDEALETFSTLHAAYGNIKISSRDKTAVTLDNLRLDLDILSPAGADFALRASFDGLKTNTAPEGQNPVFPAYMDIDIGLSNLPVAELTRLGRTTLQETMKGTASAKQLAGLQAMILLPQMLSQAGTKLAVNKLGFGNSVYKAFFEGDVTADASSAIGAKGHLKGEMTNLDSLLSTLKQQEKYQTTFQKLLLIDALGQEDQNAKGEKIKRYDIALNEDGSFSLNGNPLIGAPAEDTTTPRSNTPAP
ncbi:MAG: hypothetical protein H6853_08865 [Rhodospirillales bacterium]|nr:hypothetical protein [Alphaproteobacteria bacterium]USO03616.1 MAG: hypothetical protein H6853_08865 [Rhodospirillales bacterium]